MPNTQTLSEYNQIIAICKSLFEKKNRDYGSAWRIMRLPSITDQIFIKAKRIRSIQEAGKQLVEDDINSEFLGIINYCIIALIQMGLPEEAEIYLPAQDLLNQYEAQAQANRALLEKKNHDYGEAWREMRVSSMTDQILMKLLRIKQIEDNEGKTLISEGVESIYRDILNYAVFSLIQQNFLSHASSQ